MASVQDEHKQYADQHDRKNNEHFIVGDEDLFSTAILQKTQFLFYLAALLTQFVGPFTIAEVVGYLSYRLSLLSI